MKGRSGKTPLLVDEPALLSDQESDDEKDNHRKENNLQNQRRQASWKQRLGFGAVLANTKKEVPALNRYDSNSSIHSHSNTTRSKTANSNHYQNPSDRSPQHSLNSDQQSNPPERSSQHERQRSNDSFHQMTELEYDEQHENDQGNTVLFSNEDFFAGANVDDRTSPKKITPKTTTVTFMDDHSNSHITFEGMNSFPDQGIPEDAGDEADEEEFAKMAAQEEASSKDSKAKPMTISRSRAMLSRPFGRSSLPQSMVKKWTVEVSPAEWDGEEELWKYRILVQRRMQVRDTAVANGNEPQQLQPEEPSHSLSTSSSNLTTAYTWRSLADFIWLETALRAEYHGALLLPLLSIALGTSDLASYTQHEVDANLLRDWLSDVLNGIRGQGELLLPSSKSINLMTSEAMEAFLYRNTDPLTQVKTSAMKTMANHVPSSSTTKSNLDRSNTGKTMSNDQESAIEESFVQSLFSKPLAACGALESVVCGTDHTVANETDKTRQRKKSTAILRKHLPMDVMACTSEALGDAHSLNVQDSFVEQNQDAQAPLSRLAKHSQLLEAQRELTESWYRTAMMVMEKLRILVEEESQLGAAWKRFAISLSNLFAYEKDVEHARIGNSKLQRENLPYRKIHKSTVEDCLRVLAKHKIDRSVLSLRLLSSMLTAYVGDLSAAGPAIQIFDDALEQLEYLREQDRSGATKQNASPTSWHEQLRNALGFSLFHEPNQLKKTSSRSPTRPAITTSLSSDNKLENHKKAFELRVVTHEAILRDGLTTLCRTTLLRTARMAWKFYHVEASQAMLVQSAAMTLRSKLKNVVNKEVLSKMIRRHTEEEKVDVVTELNIVQRIVSILGSKPKRNLKHGDSDMKENVEVDHEVKPLEEVLGEEALQLARERLGRWDAKVALAIMKAVGVEDPNVHLEETTRDLRVVRKFAIGLREHLSRCVESLQVLQETVRKPVQSQVMSTGTPPTNPESATTVPGSFRHIREVRREFWSEMAQLSSGKAAEDGNQSKLSSSSSNALAAAGINTADPAGWSAAMSSSPTADGTSKRSVSCTGRCGEAACSYVDTKDSETDAVLRNISQLLEEYNRRVEGIESFVYMECVGIQLEKHFSAKRAKTLAAFEKKTDITTAITIATRKQLPLLVNELKGKLKKVGADISQTTVRVSKELHLESKTLKTELHDLAMRRLMRARETCTERAIDIMNLWAEYEEGGATFELRSLDDAKTAVEKGLRKEDINAFLAHANSALK